MVGRGANMSSALTRNARLSEPADMEEWMESARGSETLEVGRSKRWLKAPLTFLLSLRSMLPELPAGRFWGIARDMARISSSRTWSCSLRRLLDLRRIREESVTGSLRTDWDRWSLARPFGEGGGLGWDCE